MLVADRKFHLAFPVRDLAETIDFYHGLLGCPLGRQATNWADFDFFGNQISAHYSPGELAGPKTNPVDGDKVPVRHFGAILEWAEWEALAEKLKAAGVFFVLLFRPQIEDLILKRDKKIKMWQKKHPGKDIFEDRDLEVTSESVVSVEQQIRGLEKALGVAS